MKMYRFVMLCVAAVLATLVAACEPDAPAPTPDDPTPEQPTPDDPSPEPEPEPVPDPEMRDNIFEIRDVYTGDLVVDSVYADSENGTTTYTICYGRCKSFAYIDDAMHIVLTVDGYDIGESFDIDLAQTDKAFSMKVMLYDKRYNVYSYFVDNNRRDGAVGRFTLKEGVISAMLAVDDLSLETYFEIEAFRALNECTEVVNDEYSTMFAPQSVVLDNSDDESYYIYVSSKADVTTVAGMSDAELVIEYPADGWNTLLSRNFISGSNYPAMKFTMLGNEYVKGQGSTLGMNCQFRACDLELGTIAINANLYVEEGGVAVFYKGGFTLIE